MPERTKKVFPEGFQEDDYRTYVRNHGFQHNGEWYFRIGLLPEIQGRPRNWLLGYLEGCGIISRLGTPSDLKKIGANIPEDIHNRGATIFYKSNQDEVRI